MKATPDLVEKVNDLLRRNGLVEHDWFYYSPTKSDCCRRCGVVRRADDQNGPCRGPVKVTVKTIPEANSTPS